MVLPIFILKWSGTFVDSHWDPWLSRTQFMIGYHVIFIKYETIKQLLYKKHLIFYLEYEVLLKLKQVKLKGVDMAFNILIMSPYAAACPAILNCMIHIFEQDIKVGQNVHRRFHKDWTP